MMPNCFEVDVMIAPGGRYGDGIVMLCIKTKKARLLNCNRCISNVLQASQIDMHRGMCEKVHAH